MISQVTTLLVSAVAGVLAGSAYHCLKKVASSERIRALIVRRQADRRIRHRVLELALFLIALPLVVGPFALLIALPRWFAAAGLASDPVVTVVAPMTALLALGVTMRISGKQNRERRAG